MIYIYYNFSPGRLKAETFYFFFQQFPPSIQGEIMKFRKWQDRQRSLLGKALLVTGLKSMGLKAHSLYDLRYTEYHRPYFEGEIDFNISHSAEYTVCAISDNGRVGIDIEEIREIPFHTFDGQFSNVELEGILKAENSLNAFYKLWSQKESFVKGMGTGLYIPLNKVTVQNNRISWEDQEWFLHEVNLDQRYVSYFSTNKPVNRTLIEEIKF